MSTKTTQSRTRMPLVRSFPKSDALRAIAHDVIPGGAHTYSKGDDQFPQLSPGFIERGEGCFVWDVDGNRYIDYGMGIRSVVLGHAFPAVIDRVRRELPNGTNFSRPSPLEVDLALELRRRLPLAEMSKFAKNGSTVTTAAIKLARAYTGRDLVLRCAQHPFFSYDDWFIGTTPADAGVPKPVSALTRSFDYNDADGLERMLDAERGRVACVIMEPATTNAEPSPGYLERVRELCTKHGVVLVFDEMISGFRWHPGGAIAHYGSPLPDLVTYGKAIANGFSLCALTGRREIMELGGIRHDRDRVFLISTTHGAETIGLVAALETIRLVDELNVPAHLWRVGSLLIAALNAAARDRGLDRYVEFGGVPCNPMFNCRDSSGAASPAFKTLLMQEMIARGVLLVGPVVSYAHTDAVIEDTVNAYRDALNVYAAALEEGVERYLVGPPVRPVFRRRN